MRETLDAVDHDAASILVDELSCLPLAIVQAATYLRATGNKIESYAELYRRSRIFIWNWMPRRERSKDPKDRSYISVATTMALAFEKIKQEELSVRLFCLLSLFSSNNIPELLFTNDSGFKDERLRQCFSARETLNDALEPLLAYAFIERSSANASISIHKLLQDIMRDILANHEMDKARVVDGLESQEKTEVYWLESTFESLAIAYPKSDPESWGTCETLNPHAFSCIEHNRKHYKREGVWRDHINTADTISNLGITYDHQGKYDEAIAQYERALRIFEKTFGVNHINTANTIVGLGCTYDSQGRYDEASAKYERALRIFEKAFGADHINTAETINNLGSTYDSQGRCDEARAQYERALRIYEKAFGVDHVNSASTLYNIGLTYKNMGDWMSAKSYFVRAASLHRLSRGEAHEFTIVSERELACTIEALNDDSRRSTK